jgi:hypothetical protein
MVGRVRLRKIDMGMREFCGRFARYHLGGPGGFDENDHSISR